VNIATTDNRRIYLGSELVASVDRFPSPIEFDDDDDDRSPVSPDLGLAARLARTAQRGVLDYIYIDDTVAGNPPFSGRRRNGLDSIRLATRLASATAGVHLIPVVRSSWVEPSSLLEALVGLEIASAGRHGWELQLLDHASPNTHSGELLTAIVEDAWSEGKPRTKLAASARAMRRQRMSAGPDAAGRPDPATRVSPKSRPGRADQRAHGQTGSGPLRPRPTLVIRADTPQSAVLAAERADIARIKAASADDAAAKRTHLQDAAVEAGRAPESVKVLVDLTVTLAAEVSHAEARKDLAEGITGQQLGGGFARYIGTPAGLAESCAEWADQGACDGFTFLPTSLPVDLMMVVDGVTPALAAIGRFPSAYGRAGHHSAATHSVPPPRRREQADRPRVGSARRPG
jgi:alkanesulfonate monooxygenase SsuD/methylene tetrahydromethanopterin reductase-like flavin-dependent oxidoreductase (luciferase family)